MPGILNEGSYNTTVHQPPFFLTQLTFGPIRRVMGCDSILAIWNLSNQGTKGDQRTRAPEHHRTRKCRIQYVTMVFVPKSSPQSGCFRLYPRKEAFSSHRHTTSISALDVRVCSKTNDWSHSLAWRQDSPVRLGVIGEDLACERRAE